MNISKAYLGPQKYVSRELQPIHAKIREGILQSCYWAEDDHKIKRKFFWEINLPSHRWEGEFIQMDYSSTASQLQNSSSASKVYSMFSAPRK